jgi:hypothetical protein
MANISIWPGSSSFFPGDTPFGYYDCDDVFQQDVDKIADWCAKKLGYPIMEVEMQDINFYACIEEAISEFSIQVNMMNAKDYMLTLAGTPTGSTTLNNRLITPNLGRTIDLAHNYGTEVGSGGDVDWKKGYIDMVPGSQSYDLDVLWANVSESGNRIEVKRVYHDFSPAISRYFDPYVGTGAGTQQLLDGFGWGSYSPAVNFLVMPLYADLLRIQAIEMNDQIRKSSYTFELRNNKLNLFPIPTVGVRMWFEYVVTEDRNNPVKNTNTGLVTDLSNIPYGYMEYRYISPIGKQWIYKYALALAKELLGNIRGKYTSIPIPGAETTLNGTDLVAQGREDRTNLVTELKELLQSMTRQGQFEQEQAIATAMNYQLGKVPLPIYIK